MAKRLTMMLLRNILLLPYILIKLMYYATTDKVSEEKKYKLIRLIGLRGCKSGNVIVNVIREVRAGRNYLIFPEGTRSRNGNRLGEFKSGSFKAATKAKCPIVPIAIIDSYLPFDTNSTRHVDVQLHFLPPIPYEEYKGMKTTEIADMVKSRIEKVIEENEHNFNNQPG